MMRSSGLLVRILIQWQSGVVAERLGDVRVDEFRRAITDLERTLPRPVALDDRRLEGLPPQLRHLRLT